MLLGRHLGALRFDLLSSNQRVKFRFDFRSFTFRVLNAAFRSLSFRASLQFGTGGGLSGDFGNRLSFRSGGLLFGCLALKFGRHFTLPNVDFLTLHFLGASDLLLPLDFRPFLFV